MRRKNALARHRCLPALSPNLRHRRHLGGKLPQNRQARINPLPRQTTHRRQRTRPGISRPRTRKGTPRTLTRDRHRRAIRRQVLRARCPRHPPPPPRRFMPGRHRRLLFGRPPSKSQNHQGRNLHRETRKKSRSFHPGKIPRLEIQRRADQSRPRHGGNPQDAEKISGHHRCRSHRHNHRRPRQRPRKAQGDPRRNRRLARLLQTIPGLLRRTRQDPAGHALRLLRPHHRRTHGRLCRSLPIARRIDGDAGQRQSLASGDRCLQKTWRILPRLGWRPRGIACAGSHPLARSRRLPRTRHGSSMENHRRKLPRLHPRR